MHTVLLYYKYVPITNPEKIRDEQSDLCKKLGIKGRILVSEEGVNGTISGSAEAIEEYKKKTTEYPEFKDIEWKVSQGSEDIFPKLRVVVRDEIVTLGLKTRGNDVSLEHKAEYIEPEDLYRLYENEEDFVIIDGRNEYEARIGKFKNSFYFDVEAFREIPQEIKKIEKFKDKLVVTYCTGGVRCEKFSAYLKEQGFKNVKQLHGGIHRYSDETGGKHFEGEMYVFDGRVSVPVNHVDPSVISKCAHCDIPIARFINCANAECNKRIICCESCQEKMKSACSDECIEKAIEWTKKREVKKASSVSSSNSN